VSRQLVVEGHEIEFGWTLGLERLAGLRPVVDPTFNVLKVHDHWPPLNVPTPMNGWLAPVKS
jgi:hypothetical protein